MILYFAIGVLVIVITVGYMVAEHINHRRAARVDQAIEFWARVNSEGVAHHLPIYRKTLQDLGLAAEKAQAQADAFNIAFRDPEDTQPISADVMQAYLTADGEPF